MNRLAAAIFFVGLAQASWACFVPPPELMRSTDEIIGEASAIVVVEANAPPGSDGACSLRVVRTLKGQAPPSTQIPCHLGSDTDFNHHAYKEPFWTGLGRLGIDPACRLESQAFYIGHRYLLLIGIAPDTKQSEQVDSPKDKWLAYVARRVAH
jgi:hypothetical protein